MKLLPTETCLTGKWLLQGGQVVADEVCVRIEELIKIHLIKLGHDVCGRDTIYMDLADKRLWELVYPESDRQGGGAPVLQYMDARSAKKNMAVSLQVLTTIALKKQYFKSCKKSILNTGAYIFNSSSRIIHDGHTLKTALNRSFQVCD